MPDANAFHAASAIGLSTRPERAMGKDPLRDLVPLRRLLRNLLADSSPPELLSRALNGAVEKLAPVRAEINALLCSARLPLPVPVRTLTLALRELQGLTITGLENICLSGIDESGDTQSQLLNQLTSQLISCSSVNSVLPARFWTQAIQAYEQGSKTPQAALAKLRFHTLITAAVVQPESFAPWELIFVVEVARRYASKLTLHRQLPTDPRGWFWLDETGRFPPMSLAREHFALHDGAYFFCFDEVLEAIEKDLEHPTPRTAEEGSSLPEYVADPQYRTVLNRALGIWRTPLQRKFPRRRLTYRLQVCTRLGELWRSLSDPSHPAIELSEWMVVNESAKGLAIMHIEGDISGLTSGGVIGLCLHHEERSQWKLGIVRWIRSENSLHVELGIELIAPEVVPVRVVPENQGSAANAVPAMLIPSTDGGKTPETLLVTCNDLAEQPFTMILEKGEQLRLTSCRFGTPIYDGGPLQIIPFERLTPAG